MTETEVGREELSLLPEEQPEIQPMMVPLDLLPTNEELGAKEPAPELVDWIRAVSLLQPVVLGRREHGYAVHDGRRRIKAYRKLAEEWERDNGVETTNPWMRIPANVIDDQHYQAHEMLTLMIHATRNPNPLAELASVQSLISKGYSIDQISRKSSIDKETIKKRLKLLTIDEGLRKVMESGKMAVSTAEKAVKLPPQAQKRLMKVYEEKDRITGKDVEEQTRARVQQAAASSTLSGLSDLPGVDDVAEDQAEHGEPYNESEDLQEALSHLQARIEEAGRASHNQRPRWSKKDLDMVNLVIATFDR